MLCHTIEKEDQIVLPLLHFKYIALECGKTYHILMNKRKMKISTSLMGGRQAPVPGLAGGLALPIPAPEGYERGIIDLALSERSEKGKKCKKIEMELKKNL